MLFRPDQVVRVNFLGNQTIMNVRISYSLRSLLLTAIRAGRLPRSIQRRTFVTSVAHPLSWFLPGSCWRFWRRFCVSRIAIRIFMRFGPRLYQQLVKDKLLNWSRIRFSRTFLASYVSASRAFRHIFVRKHSSTPMTSAPDSLPNRLAGEVLATSARRNGEL
jgi:hypothetical protein